MNAFTVNLGASNLNILPTLYSDNSYEFSSVVYYPSGLYPMEGGLWHVRSTLTSGTYYLELQNTGDHDRTFNLRVY
ncbi:hypothetical protein [Spirochaeta dissipatitropha]